jgi:hypothetical protein
MAASGPRSRAVARFAYRLARPARLGKFASGPSSFASPQKDGNSTRGRRYLFESSQFEPG